MKPKKSYYWRDMTPEEIREYWRRTERSVCIWMFSILGILLLIALTLRFFGVFPISPPSQ